MVGVEMLPSCFDNRVLEVTTVIYDVWKQNAIVPKRHAFVTQSLLELVTVDFAKTNFLLNI